MQQADSVSFARVLALSFGAMIGFSWVVLAENPPKFDPDDPRAKGVILVFYHWPDEEEKTAILEKTGSAGLKKTTEIALFKAWIFAWPQWKKGINAGEVCESLADIPSLEYCEPDYLLGPAD